MSISLMSKGRQSRWRSNRKTTTTSSINKSKSFWSNKLNIYPWTKSQKCMEFLSTICVDGEKDLIEGQGQEEELWTLKWKPNWSNGSKTRSKRIMEKYWPESWSSTKLSYGQKIQSSKQAKDGSSVLSTEISISNCTTNSICSQENKLMKIQNRFMKKIKKSNSRPIPSHLQSNSQLPFSKRTNPQFSANW